MLKDHSMLQINECKNDNVNNDNWKFSKPVNQYSWNENLKNTDKNLDGKNSEQEKF